MRHLRAINADRVRCAMVEPTTSCEFDTYDRDCSGFRWHSKATALIAIDGRTIWPERPTESDGRVIRDVRHAVSSVRGLSGLRGT